MKREDFYLLPPLVQEYLVYIEAIKGHSSLSVIEYASDLRTFFKYIAEIKHLSPAVSASGETDLRCIDINVIKTITLSDAYQFLIYLRNERGNNENEDDGGEIFKVEGYHKPVVNTPGDRRGQRHNEDDGAGHTEGAT